ncbi:MAG TPA: cytochrome b, partial [Pseudomonas sp.]|nr:cytochrome b [Pseudomonas sp.]
AVAVFGLFALGFWMVGLNYYSSWYRTAPDLHKSIGILLLLVMLLRVLWRFVSPAPAPLASQGRLTRTAARL